MWLTDHMAQALAATTPALHSVDVIRAADKLAAHYTSARVIDDLLRSGANLLEVRRVVELPLALRDIAET